MANYHGVTTREVKTGLIPTVNSDAGLPVVFGVAPIFMTKNPEASYNTPILAYSYEEAVKSLGFIDANAGTGRFEYNLSEFMDSHYRKFESDPVVFVNVLDPTDVEEKTEELKLVNGKATLKSKKAFLNSFVVKKGDDELESGVDYLVTYNTDGSAVVSSLNSDSLAKNDDISVTFNESTYELSKDDVIGGVNPVTGLKSGLELVDEVFPRFRIVPGQLVSPGFSSETDVAAVMTAKANNINGLFKALALTDIAPTETNYTKIPGIKNSDNFVDPNQVVCWPMVSLSGKVYNLSTQLAGLVCRTDAEYGGVPYKSPSNENLQMDSSVAGDDNLEVVLDPQNANYLNQQGIYTALNFIGGWKGWGNRTAAYPGNTDPKDAFIAVRRMFNWVSNTLILTYWQKVDEPTNTRQIDSIVDSINLWLNGLTAQGYLLGGRVEFLTDDNPVLDLMDGMTRFRIMLTPPVPNEQIEFILEFDPEYLQTLFN